MYYPIYRWVQIKELHLHLGTEGFQGGEGSAGQYHTLDPVGGQVQHAVSRTEAPVAQGLTC